MNYAIEILKEKLRDELIATEWLLKVVDGQVNRSGYSNAHDLLAKTVNRVTDLEKALEVLSRESTTNK